MSFSLGFIETNCFYSSFGILHVNILENLTLNYRRNWLSNDCIIKQHSTIFLNMTGKKVSIIGSGNWGSAIAKIIGKNVKQYDEFDNEVKLWVFEELIDGKKLTEIINTTHENVKYLPKHHIPDNVVAIPDVIEACKEADILVFVLPHQFLPKTLEQMKDNIKPDAIGLSLIKGFDLKEGGGLQLISHSISRVLGLQMNVLMGANLAPEVAAEKFCETTIGARNLDHGARLKRLIQTDYFRVMVVDDADTVELCGALKNVVACAAGFVDGLGYGDNTKAAVIRLGLMEMIKFAEMFYPGARLSTFFESCGVADLVTTCYGGRNRKVSEAFAKSSKSIEDLEQEMLNGQRLQGPETAAEVHFMLEQKKLLDKFPLFVAVHRICKGDISCSAMIDCIKEHPEHL